jgi:alpha-ketoglutarate-dependent taurine dioxygenase
MNSDDKGKTEKVYHEVQRPAVIEHPVTGRPILFVNPMHTRDFTGMTREEAWPLIEELAQHATQDRFVYYHHWRVGDVTDVGRAGHDAPRSRRLSA